MKKTTLAILSMATLTACGGGGGSSDSNTKDPVTPSTAITMSGKAIDEYIQGAAVYLDPHFNRQWDDGEPQTTTNAAGDYRLELPEELRNLCSVRPSGCRCTRWGRRSGSGSGHRSLSDGAASDLCTYHPR